MKLAEISAVDDNRPTIEVGRICSRFRCLEIDRLTKISEMVYSSDRLVFVRIRLTALGQEKPFYTRKLLRGCKRVRSDPI